MDMFNRGIGGSLARDVVAFVVLIWGALHFALGGQFFEAFALA